MTKLKTYLVCGLLYLLTQAFLAHAEVGKKSPSLDGFQTAGPYYNPASKSYYELIRVTGMIKRPDWENVKIEAEKRFVKDTQGRLATIKNLETHQFIMKNFKGGNFFIGLQYFCSSRTLKWVDGLDAAATGFPAWDSKWSNTHIRTAGEAFMPFHDPIDNATRTLRWRASGPRKFYELYLVEYPTGKE